MFAMTRQQLATSAIGWGSLPPGFGIVLKDLPATYEAYRTIRKHPTVALARAMTIAPVVASSWSYVTDGDIDDDVVAFVRRTLDKHRAHIVDRAMAGRVDYGWCPFEVIWGYVRDGEALRWAPKRFKHLLVDLTEVAVSNDRSLEPGAYAGFYQVGWDGRTVALGALQALLFNWDVEGDYYYGRPLLENARRVFNAWENIEDAAERYDVKLAGGFLSIRYPIGETEVNGVLKSNATIAAEIGQALQAAGVAHLPQRREPSGAVAATMTQADNSWDIGVVSDNGSSGALYVERLNYLDRLLVRSLLWPERSLLEASSGTRADADSHKLGGVGIRQIEAERIAEQVTAQIVRPLVAFNFGEEWSDSIRIEAAPIVDTAAEFAREIYRALLASPLSGDAIARGLDIDALTDQLGLPKLEEVMEVDEADRMRAAYNQQLAALANGGDGGGDGGGDSGD